MPFYIAKIQTVYMYISTSTCRSLCHYSQSNTYPIGTRLVYDKFLFGLALLIGMVSPYREDNIKHR